jgi:hypothetical protein
VWIFGGYHQLGENTKKWKTDFVLDARQTAIGDQKARIGGIRLGIERRRIYRFGIGLYGFSNTVHSPAISGVEGQIESAEYEFSYLAGFYERVLYFNRKWEVSATVHLGLGSIQTKYKLVGDEQFTILDPISVRPMEISSSAYFNLTWWLSVGGGLGMRYMRESPPEVQDVYNGLLYMAKVKLKFGKIVRSFFNKSVKDEY